MGIVNGDDYQIVYSDTPGIVDPAYRLHEGMMNFVLTAIQDADLFLILVEAHEKKFKNEEVLEKINKSGIPVLLLINKIDLIKQDEVEEKYMYWKGVFENADVVPISALHNFNVDVVMDKIKEKLPLSPPYFSKDELTDKPQRFFVSEIIREKIFLHYKKELPYACEVVIESFKEEEEIIRIRAEIFVERDSQKGILIGHRGAGLKRVGSEARRDLESFFGKKIFLETYVKVDKNWRTNERKLKKYGYIQ